MWRVCVHLMCTSFCISLCLVCAHQILLHIEPVARSFGCDLCILLTDVDGVFDRPPKEKDAKLLPFFSQDQSVGIGEKSLHGRGGMESKITAAQFAVAEGSKCRACVVCNGDDMNAIRSVVGGEEAETDGSVKGTLFATPGSDLEKMALQEAVESNVSCLL